MNDPQDELLKKADALMQRRRVAGTATAAAEEDVPVLTDIVDPLMGESAPAALKKLDGVPDEVARRLDAWLSAALPQIVRAELDGISERVAHQALLELREELLPQL